MKTNKWLILGLVVSIAVNLALLGFMAGRASVHQFRPPVMDTMMGVGRILHDLPSERREQLKPKMRQFMRDLRPDIRAIRSAQQQMRDAIVADPFVAENLRLALIEFSTRLGNSQTNSHQAFVDLISAFTPTERTMLVERLQHGPQSRPTYRYNHRPPEPGLQ